MKDHYAILGLQPHCQTAEVKQAFRQLALRYHPDVMARDEDASARFLAIREAYETLVDPELREQYDIQYVQHFPGYELEGVELEDLPSSGPAPRGRYADQDSYNTDNQIGVFLYLLLPIIGGGLVMEFSGRPLWALAAAGVGLLGAMVINGWIRDRE